MRFAFGEPEAERHESLRARFLEFYSGALAVHTRLFDGFERVLDAIEALGHALGHRHQQAGLAGRRRSLAAARPRAALRAASSPATRSPSASRIRCRLLHAAGLLGLEPRECVYVGDAERDVQAARNAGMIPLVAGFGYLGDGEDPAAWRAEAIFARPEDLIDWLELADDVRPRRCSS